MGELTDKIKGGANQAIGKGKRKVGEATDSPDLKAKGDLQAAKGTAQKAKGAVKGALGDKV